MRVANRHHLQMPWPPGHLYIGRGTALGNQFRTGADGDRAQVVEKYRTWLLDRIEQLDGPVITAMLSLRPEDTLVCSCAPLACHGDVIAEVWQELFQSHAWAKQHRKPSMAYAGIGARATPSHIQPLISKVARRLALRGFTLRSGGAAGADQAFEHGCVGFPAEIFLPWKGYQNNASERWNIPPGAMQIASCIHPAWQGLSHSEQKFIAGAGLQILGQKLNKPVDFVVCWTPDGAQSESECSRKTGGTGQAIALADRWQIPIFNLARPDALNGIAKFLGSAHPAAAMTAQID